MTPIPKRLWVIFDPSADGDGYLGWFATQREARERCRKFNAMRGYEPVCKVVRFDMAAVKRSAR